MPKLIYPDLCPDCGYGLSPSRRRGWIEKLITRFFKIGVFRCHRCGSRFYSPPAVVVHAPKPDSVRASREIVRHDFREPAVVVSPESGPVRQVVVNIAKPVVVEKAWPSTRQNWTHQALNNGGAPFLWTRSSTDQKRSGDSH
jgi:hypothetical protein